MNLLRLVILAIRTTNNSRELERHSPIVAWTTDFADNLERLFDR